MLSSVCDSHSDSMVLDQNRMHNVNGYHNAATCSLVQVVKSKQNAATAASYCVFGTELSAKRFQ